MSEASWNVSRSPLATSTVPSRRSSPWPNGGKKIVSLVARTFGVRKAACRNEVRNHRELFDDVVVKFASALIRGEGFVPVSRRLISIPSDQDGARPLLAVEAQQQIGETEYGAGRPIALSSDILRQSVKGAVGKTVQ